MPPAADVVSAAEDVTPFQVVSVALPPPPPAVATGGPSGQEGRPSAAAQQALAKLLALCGLPGVQLDGDECAGGVGDNHLLNFLPAAAEVGVGRKVGGAGGVG